MESSEASDRDLSDWTVVLDQYELPSGSELYSKGRGSLTKGWRWWAKHKDGREISVDKASPSAIRDSLGHGYYETKTEAEEDAARSISEFDAQETREMIDGAKLIKRVRERN
jgi:hypothetical protein